MDQYPITDDKEPQIEGYILAGVVEQGAFNKDWIEWAKREIDRLRVTRKELRETLEKQSQELLNKKVACEGFEAWIRNRDPILKIHPIGRLLKLTSGVDAEVEEIKIGNGNQVTYCVSWWIAGTCHVKWIHEREILQRQDILPPAMIEINE